MAFKIATGPKTVWWPVDIQVPLDGGRVETQKIDAELEILPQSDYDAILRGESDAKDLLERVVRGLRQRKKDAKAEDEPLQDEDGQPLAFEDAKRLILNTAYIRVALFGAYVKASSGQGREKN